MVTDEAAAAGIASVPAPVGEDASDWFVYERLMNRHLITTTGSTSGILVREIDSKAMRKVDIGEDLISVVEADPVAFGDGVILRVYTRTLVKLH